MPFLGINLCYKLEQLEMNKDKLKVVVTGAEGMLGRDVSWFLKGPCEVIPLARDRMDITSWTSVVGLIGDIGPDWVINCAAVTDVNGAEKNPGPCIAVNATGAENVARASARAGARLIHISTDYVFRGGRFKEVDTPTEEALNVYGESKRQGELMVRAADPKARIARVSATYGVGRKNFVDWVADSVIAKKEIKVVDDEVVSPTWVRDVSTGLWTMIKQDMKEGVYHVVNKGETSRFGQAVEIARVMGAREDLVVRTSNFQRAATVAKESVLISTKIKGMSTWQDAMGIYLQLTRDI